MEEDTGRPAAFGVRTWKTSASARSAAASKQHRRTVTEVSLRTDTDTTAQKQDSTSHIWGLLVSPSAISLHRSQSHAILVHTLQQDALKRSAVITALDHRHTDLPDSDAHSTVLDLVGHCSSPLGQQFALTGHSSWTRGAGDVYAITVSFDTLPNLR